MKASKFMQALSTFAAVSFPDFFAVVEHEEDFFNLKAKRLLSVKVDDAIDSFDDRGYTPLHCAVEKPASWDLIDIFLNEYSANINSTTREEGWTPLILALKLKNKNLLRRILDVPAVDVNLPGYDSRSALHIACQLGDLDLVSLLLDRRASPDLSLKGTEMKPVHFAILHRHLDVLNLFRERDIPLNALYLQSTGDGQTFLGTSMHLLAQMNETSFPDSARIEMVALLASDPTFNQLHVDGKSALKVAVECGNDAIVAALLVFGADWSEPGLEGNVLVDGFKERFPSETSIEPQRLPEVWNLAIHLESLHLLSALKAANVSTERIDEGLIIQAMIDRIDSGIICELIGLISDPEKINCRDMMYFAVTLRLPRVLSKLIDVFQPTDYTVNSGQTLLHLAAVPSPSEIESPQSCIEIVKILISAAPNLPNQDDYFHNTPLHIAASNGSKALFRGLISCSGSVEVDKRDENGHTALFLAFKAQRYDICMNLLVLGANMDDAYDPLNKEDRFMENHLLTLFQELPDEDGDKKQGSESSSDKAASPMALYGEARDSERRMETFEVEHDRVVPVIPLLNAAISTAIDLSKNYVVPYVPYLQAYFDDTEKVESVPEEAVDFESFLEFENTASI